MLFSLERFRSFIRYTAKAAVVHNFNLVSGHVLLNSLLQHALACLAYNLSVIDSFKFI